MKNQFSNMNEEISTYSRNIRTINGHWMIFASAQPIQFSVWSVQKTYAIPGYGKFEFIARDKNGPPIPNCGGGVGLFVDEKYKDYEILKEESVFIPHVYESLRIKIKNYGT